jgi:hypothetical protein
MGLTTTAAPQDEEERLRREMAELQLVRDRVAAMRRWLSAGGQLDPSDPMAADFEVLLASALTDCGGDPMQLSALLSDRCALVVLRITGRLSCCCRMYAWVFI